MTKIETKDLIQLLQHLGFVKEQGSNDQTLLRQGNIDVEVTEHKD